MKKIIVLINDQAIDESELGFCAALCKLSPATVNGILLHPGPNRELKEHGEHLSQSNITLAKTKDRNIKPTGNIENDFRNACKYHNIPGKHQVTQVQNLEELLRVTLFADVLLVSEEIVHQVYEEYEGGLLLGIMAKSECPVLIAPRKYDSINQIVFTYDGSESAVYAIKQFTYLYPEFSGHKIVVLQVKEKAGAENEGAGNIGEYLKLHYRSSVAFHSLYGNMHDQLFNYFIGKKNLLVVMGASKRSRISLGLNKNDAGTIMNNEYLPLFITQHI